MNNLKKIRLSHNLTLRELEKEININNATLSNLELGKTHFNNDYIKILTDFFNVSADYLLGLTSNPTREILSAPVYDWNKKLLEYLPLLLGSNKNDFYIKTYIFDEADNFIFEPYILYLVTEAKEIKSGDLLFIDFKNVYAAAKVFHVEGNEIFFSVIKNSALMKTQSPFTLESSFEPPTTSTIDKLKAYKVLSFTRVHKK